MITPNSATFATAELFTKGLSAFGLYKSAQEQKAAYGYNASLAEENARTIRQSGELVAFQKQKNLEALVGHQYAQYAASGVSVTSGSPLDVMTDTLAKGHLDIAIEKYNNELAARSYESNASMSRYAGAQTSREGTFKAGLTLLEAASTYNKPAKKRENSGLE